MDSRHECPEVTCHELVPRSRLACRRDWYRLPKRLRDAVWAGYREGAGSEAHMDAISEALGWYRANPRPIRLPEPR